jgi:hypothetical protein
LSVLDKKSARIIVITRYRSTIVRKNRVPYKPILRGRFLYPERSLARVKKVLHLEITPKFKLF